MNICPICDKKIAGSWCSSCHRFVKPWKLSDGIHINESHSKVNDVGCEYHNTQGLKKPDTNKKGKKNSVVKVIVVVYVVIFLLQIITTLIGRFSFDFLKTPEREEALLPESIPEEYNILSQIGVDAISVDRYDDMTIYNYDIEDIRALDSSFCTHSHMDITMEAVRELMADSFGKYDFCNTVCENNYISVYEDKSYMAEFYICEDWFWDKGISVEIVYDTVTDEVHYMDISCDKANCKEVGAFICSLLSRMNAGLTSEDADMFIDGQPGYWSYDNLNIDVYEDGAQKMVYYFY